MPKGKSKTKHRAVYVVAGEDASLVWMECDRLLDGLIEREQRVTGLFKAEGKEVAVVEVLDELRTLPFLTDKRVVLIKNAEKFVSENRPLLEKYFENPSPTGILILAVSKWDSRTRLAKSLPGVGELISVTGPTGGNLLRNIKEYCQRVNGKVLEDEAADVLVEWAGDDLPRLYGEIEKLGVYVGDENRIRAGAVESLVGHNRTYNAFAVIDSCVAGDAGQAVEQLRVMFAEDKSTEYSVVGAFAFHVRRLFNGKVLLEQGLEPWMIAKKMGVWHNESGFFSQIRSMSLVRIGHLLEELADMDYAIKTGRTTAQSAVERLVIRLATDSAKGAGEDRRSSHR